MSFQGQIDARCPKCSEEFETPVWSFVHGGTDETLRNQVKARECNLLLCPRCGEAFMPDASWIYYEPAAELLAFVFPEAWKADEGRWRAKMDADFEQMKGALGGALGLDSKPEIFFGQEELGGLLEGEDWRADERDVMEHYARELGLSVYKASPRWARAHRAPSEYPYEGGEPTRAALIAGIKKLLAANDALTAWSDYLPTLEAGADGMPPAARGS